MKLDIQTLASILSLTCMTQVIAILIQYRVNKTYSGIGWWLVGSISMALGFVFLSLGMMRTIGILAIFGNPLLMFSRVCFLVGTARFVGRRENPRLIFSVLTGFVILYYIYLFGYNNVAARTIIVSSSIAVFSFLIFYTLSSTRKNSYAGSANFVGAIFLIHGCYLTIVAIYTIFSAPITSHIDFAPIQTAVFIVPIITSTLWTFGLILMVNQRLSAEILEEKENLQRVFNTSPFAALITRLEDGMIIDVNEGFLAIGGYCRTEVIDKSTLNLKIWKEDTDRKIFISEMINKGFCENMDFIYRRKNGSELVGMTSAKIIKINDIPHIICVIRDITAEKVAEEALRESEETYRSILKASPDDITITDLEGRILLVSPAASIMFGYGPDDGIGLRIHDFIVSEDQERAEANILLMHNGGHPGPSEYRAVRKDGSLFDIEVNSGFIRGPKGQPIKMVFVVRDITERKQADKERARLKALNHQLQKTESLGRMAGAIAHHFNNKLQSVMANLELLGGVPSNSDPTRYLTMAKRATEEAAAISRLLLVYLGQASDKQEPQYLARVCSQGMDHLQSTLPGSLAVQMDLPSPGPVVSVNADQIHQVLANLVVNAAEAVGAAAGSLQLKLRISNATEIPTLNRFPIGWEPQGLNYACLEVADTGPGIAEADIEKLFDPFFSTKFSGRGLGLPVVLGIVQTHGGAIAVASELGHGSVFQVYLPIATAGIPGPSGPRLQVPQPARGGMILLVDDDESLLASTAAMIEMIGFTVLTAKGGAEAVDAFRRHRGEVHCVITDLTMPRMDGWETLTALRQMDPALPVILASGYDKAQVMASSGPDRPQGFLSKPYDLKQLSEAISQALAASAT